MAFLARGVKRISLAVGLGIADQNNSARSQLHKGLFQSLSEMHTTVLNKRMVLKAKKLEKSEKHPPLVVFLSWMLAKDKHMNKYVQFYHDRGFDSLTIKMAPGELVFPRTGSQVIAQNLVDFLQKRQDDYDRVLVHAFSVGAYLFGEILLKLQENKLQDSKVVNNVMGLIVDSGVDIEGIPTGFPRAVLKNALLIKLMEMYMKTHMKVLYSVSTKHYVASSRAFHNNFLRCPMMLLVSEDDAVGNPAANESVRKDWESLGIDVMWKCWQNSGHVSHMHYHPKEYTEMLEKFLAKIM